MDFSEALQKLKSGSAICRKGWNGKGQCIALQQPGEGNPMTSPFIYICTVEGFRVPWLASQTDLLANDWEVI